MNVVTREFIACNGSPTVHHSLFHLVVNSKAAFGKFTDRNGRVCYDGPYLRVIFELANTVWTISQRCTMVNRSFTKKMFCLLLKNTVHNGEPLKYPHLYFVEGRTIQRDNIECCHYYFISS